MATKKTTKTKAVTPNVTVAIPVEILPPEPSALERAYPKRSVSWDETVQAGPLRNHLGAAIPGIAGVFTEDGIYLGKYSKGEKIVQNKTLVEMVSEAFTSMGQTFDLAISTFREGAGMIARYTLRDVGVAGPDGHKLSARVMIRNSYDGVWGLGFSVEALRLVCLNGMMGFSEIASFNGKHSAKLDPAGIITRLTPEVDQGIAMIGDRINRMADHQITHEGGQHFLRNLALANRTLFSPLMAKRIEQNAWNTPAEDEKDAHGTVYGLFNAGTRFFRDMERDGKQAHVERVAPFFTMALNKAMAEPETMKRLLTPISFEDAYKGE